MPLTNLTQVTGPGIQTTTNLQVNDGNFTGIITAVSFVGDGSGLTGVANTDFVVGTAITMGTANFTGNVSIGGTLTYEDVSNIDSVGLVTARDGLFIPDNKELKVGNTASSPDLKIYHNSSNNNSYITESGNGSFFIQGSNLYLTDDDGTNMLYAANNAGVNLYWGGGQRLLTSSAGISIPKDLDVDGHTNLDNVSVAGVSTFSGSVTVGQDLFIPDKIVHSGDPDTAIRFPTNDIITAETGGTERLRIDSSGRLLIGTTSSTAHTNAGNLQIGDYSAGGAGITINTTTSGSGNIYFGDSSSSIRRGRIEYDHSNDAFRHYTADTERLRITSDGSVLIRNTADPSDYNQTDILLGSHSGHSGMTILSGTSSGGFIMFSDNNGGGANAYRGQVEYAHSTDSMRFLTNSGERLRITETGRLGINNASPQYLMHAKHNGQGGNQRIDLHMTNDTTGHNDNDGVQFGYQNSGGAYVWNFENTDIYFGTNNTTRMYIKNGGTVQVQNHLTSRNSIVQIQQVTSEVRYSGAINGVDLITGSTFTPKTSAPRFLIMIFCPVNTSDDSDAASGNTNPYHSGQIYYRKNGGSWTICNNRGNSGSQGGTAAHIELSPNRTGDQTTDHWSGNRYRMEHKCATVLVTNVGDCGSSGNVQFKLYGVSTNDGGFVQIGQPHGFGNDDNYTVQPWGFTVFELAPDNNTYTAY